MISNTNDNNKNNKNNSIDNNDIYVTNLNRHFHADIREFLQICVLFYNYWYFLNEPHATHRKIIPYSSVLTTFFFYKRFSAQIFKFPWSAGGILYFIMLPPHFLRQWHICRTIIIEISPQRVFIGITGTDFACICKASRVNILFSFRSSFWLIKHSINKHSRITMMNNGQYLNVSKITWA